MINYLIFIKRLDEIQEVEERKATTLGTLCRPHARRPLPDAEPGAAGQGDR
jgi:type I restriction enzyme M protein